MLDMTPEPPIRHCMSHHEPDTRQCPRSWALWRYDHPIDSSPRLCPSTRIILRLDAHTLSFLCDPSTPPCPSQIEYRRSRSTRAMTLALCSSRMVSDGLADMIRYSPHLICSGLRADRYWQPCWRCRSLTPPFIGLSQQVVTAFRESCTSTVVADICLWYSLPRTQMLYPLFVPRSLWMWHSVLYTLY